jgi:tetratricopeptide (TPR) repeat protein
MSRSADEGKPILLDLHSPACSGCRNLEQAIYSNPAVAQEISDYTLPVRVPTENPDKASTAIIDKHIFIWSPTIQLLAPDGTRYHEFNGAPRRTRLSVGYQTVFHDTPGHLTPELFRAQLTVARGKAALRKKQLEEAIRLFNAVIKRYPQDETSVADAKHWLAVAKSGGAMEDSFNGRALMTISPLARAVERFAHAVAKLPDSILLSDWIGKPGSDGWEWYSDCLKEIALQVYQELCDFGVAAERERALNGPEQTSAHLVLAQHRLAYREFQSLFVGVHDSLLDQYPLPSERSLRENIAHVIMAESWAWRPQILHALDRGRKGLNPEVMPATDIVADQGQPPGSHETLREMLALYERLHIKNTEDFSGITDEELGIRSAWWENGPVDLRFRLKRLVGHPRDHAIYIDKILDKLGHHRSATERFAARLFSGLGTAEGALIGAGDSLLGGRYLALTKDIEDRRSEAERLLAEIRSENLVKTPA